MSSWPQVDLEEISDISAGNPAPQDASHFCADGHPFVRMQDVGRKHIDPALVETTDRVSPLAVRECGLRLYPAGTLLIPKSGASVNLNHRAMLGQDAYVVSHLATIIPDQRKVLPSYLFHWSQRYDPRSQAQVTSLPSLPLSLIKAAKVPLPPLKEQRRIVGLLDRAAEIRRRADAARAKARAIIPALFLDMFGDPATNPKGWARVDFENAVSDVTRFVPKIMKRDYLEAGRFPVFDQGQIEVAGYTDDETMTFAAVSPLVLFGDHTRVFRLVSGRFARGADGVRMFKPKEGVDPFFLRTYLELHGLPDAGYSRHYRFLKTLAVAIPPLPLQTAFAEQARRLEATARALDAAVAKAEAMAAALSAQVFGGAPTKGNGHAGAQAG